MKFSDLHRGAFFCHGPHKAEYIKVEDFEDASGESYNSIMLSGGMLSHIRPNETVFPNKRSVGFMSGAQLHRLKSLAMDAEILRVCPEFGAEDSFRWYFYFKESDPKFGEACAWLEHIVDTKGIGSKAYVSALNKCKKTLKKAIKRDKELNKAKTYSYA